MLPRIAAVGADIADIVAVDAVTGRVLLFYLFKH